MSPRRLAEMAAAAGAKIAQLDAAGQRKDQEKVEQLYQIQAQLAEEQFFFHFAQEARHQAHQWEMAERAAYDARFEMLLICDKKWIFSIALSVLCHFVPVTRWAET